MPKPLTWAWSTLEDGTINPWDLNLDTNLPAWDLNLDAPEVTDPNAPLTWAGSTVGGWTITDPLDLWAVEEVPEWWEVTPEQQAEFDKQQAQADQDLIDQGIDPATWEPIKKVEEEVIEEVPPVIEDVPPVIEEEEVTEVTPEQQAEFDRQQAEWDRIMRDNIKDVPSFKSAWSTLENLASLVGNVYWGVAEIKWNKVFGEINWVPHQWIIDEAWNPIRTKVEEKVEMGKDDFLDTLSGMFIWGSSNDDINKFITENKDLYNANRSEIISRFKTEGINKDTLERNQAIAKMNWTELDKAIKSGSINVWDLSPEAKARYDAYLNVNRKNDITNAKDVSELVYDNTLKDYETITDNYELNAKGILDEITDLYNTGEIKDSNDALNNKYSELKKKKRELDGIWDKIRADNKWVPATLVNSKIAKEERRLKWEVNDLIDEYNVELSNYQRLERMADKEAEILTAELNLETSTYTKRLDQYNKNKWFMREDEKLAFTEANKIFAENRALANSKSLIEFQNKISKENRKWTWQTREDGLYYLEDLDGKPKATKVLDGTWNFTKNSDGTFTYMTVQDGRPYTETLDVNGNKVFTNWTTNFGANFKSLAYKYPNEASMKNNNPAWITWNQTFSDTLSAHGIVHSKWTARPTNEWGNYFDFPDIQNGMKAYSLLWDLPSYNNRTVWQALKRWGTGSVSIDIDPNTKVWDLWESDMRKLQFAQLKKESPGMWTELNNAGYIRDGNFAIPEIVEEVVLQDTDISLFNSSTFKPETHLKTASDKAKYQQFLAMRKDIFSKEDPTMEEILNMSVWGKELTQTAITRLEKFGTVLSGAWDLLWTIEEANKSTFWPWPITWKIAELNPWNTPAQTLKRQLISLIPNLARWVYWEVGVLTDNDVKLYSQTLPNLTQTEDVNKAILALTLKTIQRSYQNSLKVNASAGRDVSWFTGAYDEITRTINWIEEELGINPEANKIDHNTFLNDNWYNSINTITTEQSESLDSIFN